VQLQEIELFKGWDSRVVSLQFANNLNVCLVSLQLYCECFANGSYCCPSKCNCTSCYNNFENETARNMAIFTTLERNPNAFRSKIVVKEKLTHNKGCHCKKSFCLKK
jgi:hypothetical protein